MKRIFFISILFFIISCKKKVLDNSNFINIFMIDRDTLYEKKLPLLVFDTILKNKLDTIISNELKCEYYYKDVTCFGIGISFHYNQIYKDTIEKIYYSENDTTPKKSYDEVEKIKDTLLFFESGNSLSIDFKDENDTLMNLYGCYYYKGFWFFVLNKCKKYTNLFHETKDSVKVKNSIFLYVETEPCIDDTRSMWTYKYRNKKLYFDGVNQCEQKIYKNPNVK